MQKRLCERECKRIPLSIKAELISNGENYYAVIENISVYGMGVKIIHTNSKSILKPESDTIIRFRTPCQKIMHINCNKKWSYKNTPSSLIETIGVEITDRSKNHYDGCHSLGGEMGDVFSVPL